MAVGGPSSSEAQGGESEVSLFLCPSLVWPDIKRLYRQAGVELQATSFLFVDTQIADESFLEDINNILSSGEVPNLYKSDEFEEVHSSFSAELAFLTNHQNPTDSTSVSVASPTSQISPCEAEGLFLISHPPETSLGGVALNPTPAGQPNLLPG